MHCETGGACAEQVTVDAASVLLLPEDMSFEKGAAFTVNYLTAYFCTMHLGGLRQGGSVLIHGAAGELKYYTVQYFFLYAVDPKL